MNEFDRSGQRPNGASHKRGSRLLLWLVWAIWLTFLAEPVSRFIQAQPTSLHLTVMLTGVAAFIGLYGWATWRNVKALIASVPSSTPSSAQVPLTRTTVTTWGVVTVCAALSIGLALLGRDNTWLDFFILTSAYASGSLAVAQAVPTVGMLLVLTVITSRLMGVDASNIGPAVAYVTVVSATTIGLTWVIVANRELRQAHEDIEHLAVMNERLRIARDLHDLLGHNLSLIALKSELARRLVDTAPARGQRNWRCRTDDAHHVAGSARCCRPLSPTYAGR